MNSNEKLLVDALRSGKYKQGINYLCRDNTYCCLGVACEVASQFIELQKDAGPDTLTRYDGKIQILPMPVQCWLGWSSYGGVLKSSFVKDGKAATSLIGCNDTLNLSFEEIANLIENDWVEHSN